MILKKAILVVEDDQDTRFLYSEALSGEGYRVVEAEDGEKGIQALKNDPSIGLVLLDLTMPGMTAAEFMKEQKSLPDSAHYRTIAISGRTDTKTHSQEIKVDDFLMKPFELDHLVEKVRHYSAD